MNRLFADMELQKQFMDTGFIKVPMLSGSEILYMLGEINKLCPEVVDNIKRSISKQNSIKLLVRENVIRQQIYSRNLI
jgi:hypothetical protein